MKKAIEQEHGLPMPSRKSDFRLAIMVMLTFLNIAGTHVPVIVFIITHFAGVVSVFTIFLNIARTHVPVIVFVITHFAGVVTVFYGVKLRVYCPGVRVSCSGRGSLSKSFICKH